MYDDNNYSMKRVILSSDMRVQVMINGREIKVPHEVITVEKIPMLLELTSKLLPCHSKDCNRSQKCTGFVYSKSKSTPGPQAKCCLECKKLKKNRLKQKSRKKRVECKTKILKRKMRNRYIGLQRRYTTLQRKIKRIERNAEKLRKECATSKEEILNQILQKLPEKQKIAVEACFKPSQYKNTHSMRYTTQWIYECILLRIKSKKLYRQLRRDKILTLPSPTTLGRNVGCG
ncbi:uncharacterized protein LOC122508313 isoform X2 [Leptopilina heterotoma]|uniref:uncharacterized protein LOC122508313 isoform X2 n=1 Tax=Leptopilina heterotoma TaxID=63436 RepID=UPI001CA7ECE5|nr:uncharacterized protein LOC122508313 isoform X2 [Leptopilina heterotoma]